MSDVRTLERENLGTRLKPRANSVDLLLVCLFDRLLYIIRVDSQIKGHWWIYCRFFCLATFGDPARTVVQPMFCVVLCGDRNQSEGMPIEVMAVNCGLRIL